LASSAASAGKLVNIEQREVLTIVEGEISAAETFDLIEKMRGATREGVWNIQSDGSRSPPTCSSASGADPQAQGSPIRGAEGLRVHRQRVSSARVRIPSGPLIIIQNGL
jgi:hypothetical protein